MDETGGTPYTGPLSRIRGYDSGPTELEGSMVYPELKRATSNDSAIFPELEGSMVYPELKRATYKRSQQL